MTVELDTRPHSAPINSVYLHRRIHILINYVTNENYLLHVDLETNMSNMHARWLVRLHFNDNRRHSAPISDMRVPFRCITFF